MRHCREWRGLSEEEEDMFAKEEILIFDEGVADAFAMVKWNGEACFVETLVDQQQVGAVHHQ